MGVPPLRHSGSKPTSSGPQAGTLRAHTLDQTQKFLNWDCALRGVLSWPSWPALSDIRVPCLVSCKPNSWPSWPALGPCLVPWFALLCLEKGVTCNAFCALRCVTLLCLILPCFALLCLEKGVTCNVFCALLCLVCLVLP